MRLLLAILCAALLAGLFLWEPSATEASSPQLAAGAAPTRSGTLVRERVDGEAAPGEAQREEARVEESAPEEVPGRGFDAQKVGRAQELGLEARDLDADPGPDPEVELGLVR